MAGTLNFISNGTVTKNIGADAENSPAIINLQGDNTSNVALNNNVFAGNINFINGGKLQLSGNLKTPNLDFKTTGGTLEFNGNGQYILDATINGDNGVLNVLATLTATNVGTLKTINIGNNLASQIFTIKENNPNVTLLSIANSSINFNNANSELVISAPVEQTTTFAASLAGFTGGGGIVSLDGSTANLTVSGQNGATLGTAGNALTALNIKGNVTISDNLDVHDTNQLNIKAGANLTDQSLTSALIQNIVIGEAGANGAATYGLDAESRDFDLSTTKMKFINADSALNLQNSSTITDRTITLTGILNPGGDQCGKLKLTAGAKDLIISDGGNGYTLGIDGSRLKEIAFISTGDGIVKLNADIFVEKIVLDVDSIELKGVNSDIYFEYETVYSATGDINGKVDFQGNAGVINLADGVNINGTVTSTGQNGTLTFLGAGQVTDLITNIAMLKAGAGNVSLTAGGNYSIGEIQGNGNNNLTFAAGTNLTGGINTSGGQVVNLIFTNGGSVSDSIGSSAAVGNITVQAGSVSFGNTVNSGNIVLLNGATVEVKNNLTATDISSDNTNSGTLKLNNPAPINITSTIGANNSLNTIEVANSDAKISGGLNAQNINFSNANNAATLTLNAASNVTNVTTAGNNTHTIAVTDFTANGAIGTDTNKLKSIELLGNGLVNINTDKFYSGVTTANNRQGNVKLNIDGASSYDLGSNG